MLWIKLKVGEAVLVDNEPMQLVFKDTYGIVVSFRGAQVHVDRYSSHVFPTFTLHSGDRSRGLRLGFEAPDSVRIRRSRFED